MSGALRYDSGKVSLLNLHPQVLLQWAYGTKNKLAQDLIHWFFYGQSIQADWPALEGMLRVLEAGALKYAVHNYTHGMLYSRVMDSAMRHFAAVAGKLPGGSKDSETGLPHADHLACNWYFAVLYGQLGYDGSQWDNRSSWQNFARGVTQADTVSLTGREERYIDWMPADPEAD